MTFLVSHHQGYGSDDAAHGSVRVCSWFCSCFFFCQRTENRAHKTHVFASVCSQVMKGRGGVGGVNVPCASSATCCYAAQMSGSAASLYA